MSASLTPQNAVAYVLILRRTGRADSYGVLSVADAARSGPLGSKT